VRTRLGRRKSYKSDTGTRFWRVIFLRRWPSFFCICCLTPKLRLYGEHLVAVRVLEIEPPEKHQGRRFPAASIEQAFSIRRLCVSGCLAESIQLIKSLRSIGVRSLH
jgi:hypothetical protein